MASHGLAPTVAPRRLRAVPGTSVSRACRRLRPLVRASTSQGFSWASSDLRAVALDGARPQVDTTAWVAPNCVMLGDVRLGPRSSVWFGCTLRGDNSSITIGENSNVQEHSVLHCDDKFPLSIGTDCTIGHLVMLHGCKIGDKCLVGMGAVVLNGVTVGAGSIVGAGALIPEGKTIPPNSLVLGNPGKVVRQTGKKDWAKIRHGVRFYQHNAQRFREELEEQQVVGSQGKASPGVGIGTELEKLWALKESGGLAMDEFETAKAAVLNALR